MEIKRIEASEEAIKKANKTMFVYNSYLHAVGTEFTIKEVKYTSHSVDGKDKESAVLIIVLDAPDTVIYVRSLIKPHRTYKGEIQPITGSLNEKVISFQGRKTLEEVKTYLTKLVGMKLRATITSFSGINKLGEVQPMDINGWDLIGDFPAE